MLALVSHADVERVQGAVFPFAARTIGIVERLHLVDAVIADALLLSFLLCVRFGLILCVSTNRVLLQLLLLL